MPMAVAARKANICRASTNRYYLKYLDNPNGKISPQRKANRMCTINQVKALIHYIVVDGMPLLKASVKANLSLYSAGKYYQQYLDDPNHKIPNPKYSSSYKSGKPISLDQAKSFFGYIIIDKLSIQQASQKTNISESSGYNYYKIYLKNPTKEINHKDSLYSVEKMKKMVNYIQKDKMSLWPASNKANLNATTAAKYYRQYLRDPKRTIPKLKTKSCTPKPSLHHAYSAVIAEIYKENPDQENVGGSPDLLDVSIKQEPFNTKEEVEHLNLIDF